MTDDSLEERITALAERMLENTKIEKMLYPEAEISDFTLEEVRQGIQRALLEIGRQLACDSEPALSQYENMQALYRNYLEAELAERTPTIEDRVAAIVATLIEHATARGEEATPEALTQEIKDYIAQEIEAWDGVMDAKETERWCVATLEDRVRHSSPEAANDAIIGTHTSQVAARQASGGHAR